MLEAPPEVTLSPEEIAWCDSLPPIALDFWAEQMGKTVETVLTWRDQGFIRITTICQRHYVTREETVRFNRRLKAGEFAGEIRTDELKSSRNQPRLKKQRKK
jgi:hypothetical protein